MEAEDGIRVVVLSSVGRSFSAGADLNWMRRVAGASMEENKRDAMALAALMRTLAELRKPTVARVQGPAYGGGVGLVACCDVAVATARRHLRAHRGEAGPRPRRDLALRGGRDRPARRRGATSSPARPSRPPTPGAWAWCTRSRRTRRTSTRRSATSWIRCSPAAPSRSAECKSLIRAVAGRTVTGELIQDTAERIARIRSSPEGMEGVAAFLEKRRAAWLPPEPEPEPEPDAGAAARRRVNQEKPAVRRVFFMLPESIVQVVEIGVRLVDQRRQEPGLVRAAPGDSASRSCPRRSRRRRD